MPTLIIQRLDDRLTPPCHGRYLAAHLPAARYFEQPGSHLLWAGDTDSLFAQIEDLLTGTGQQPRTDRGTHQLPEIADPWPVFAVADATLS